MAGTKVAVVTGGNKGIGYAIVKGLCQKFTGSVYLTARDVNRGQKACEELEQAGLRPNFHQLDVTDQNSVDNFQNYLKTKYGGIDVLVNNAGSLFWNGHLESLKEAETTILVNYFGLLRVCNSLFGLLRPYSRVVNLSSSTGHLSRIPRASLRQKLSDTTLTEVELSTLMKQFVDSINKNQNIEDGWGNSAYVVSKVGVCALTIVQQRVFNKDKSRPGIIVNSVHPGYVDTEMTRNQGNLTIEQGAEAPLYLALLPKEEKKVKGAYVWYDGTVIDWTSSKSPIAPVGHVIPIRC